MASALHAKHRSHTMVTGRYDTADLDEEWSTPLRKRRKSSARLWTAETAHHGQGQRQTPSPNSRETNVGREGHSTEDKKDKSITIASTARLAPQTVAPFLAKHIPAQYAPLGRSNSTSMDARKDLNSKFCYRHRPDMLCRRQADEPSMDKLQKVRAPQNPVE